MKPTQVHPRPSNVREQDPMVKKGLQPDAPVAVPLDFLQSLSSIAHRNLERRPPKLNLKARGSQAKILSEATAAATVNPVASKETADLAYQIAELVMRRQDAILSSGDPNAIEGLKSLDRMVRMFEHIYLLSTGANQVGVSK